MLSSAKLTAFVSTTNADRARAFYRDTLGLRLVSEDGFALLFDCGGTPLRVSIAREVIPAPDGDRVAWFKDPDGNLLSIATTH